MVRTLIKEELVELAVDAVKNDTEQTEILLECINLEKHLKFALRAAEAANIDVCSH